jgi:hypothetical protein
MSCFRHSTVGHRLLNTNERKIGGSGEFGSGSLEPIPGEHPAVTRYISV